MAKYGRRYTRKRFSRRKSRYNKRVATSAYRALRIAKATNKRVAGEVCKFETTPIDYSNLNISLTADKSLFQFIRNNPLLTISSGKAWIMPINWLYTTNYITEASNANMYVDGINYNATTSTTFPTSASVKRPIYYNTVQGLSSGTTELQYRMKYIYINALFNASNPSGTNQDGALRIVIVKDKQPSSSTADWYNDIPDTVSLYNNRNVFNSNRIDAQLNPNSLGRFKIMYDKTIKFTTINGYKQFKYFKRISSVVRNNTNQPSQIEIDSDNSPYTSTSYSSPVQRNAFYLMIFSDGLQFTHTNSSITGNLQFHLFNRVAYYNN